MTLSEFNNYLKNKENSTLLDLLEPRTRSTTASHLPCWADPTLLSKTESFQVSRHYKLPNEFETIIQESNVIYLFLERMPIELISFLL